ncbi:hypothetical protein M2158_001089 [Streptomyces sp. SAI-144]|uniref:hypothetical protein n=1 Tax=Streptomyces sp. SAI-144 TaxID=2940544 RepID=UPI0024756572|nr:hypothetical protein [Streptomyces sp. SAI-144]MDH6432612.1 hypothetical protein [Streptomyces sp. SAI-144]
MDEITQADATPNTPTAFGLCHWHKGHAEGIRLIEGIEQGSGPGGNLFACGPCRETHRLVPLADRP